MQRESLMIEEVGPINWRTLMDWHRNTLSSAAYTRLAIRICSVPKQAITLLKEQCLLWVGGFKLCPLRKFCYEFYMGNIIKF